jgi:mannose-1-phosphate guanylyltransferase
MKFIITAGGQGTKLWPMSREKKPKQFQPIVGSTTLFRYQIDTLLKAYKPEDIFISTKEIYVDLVRKDATEIPEANIIVEPPYKKNRGPGEGYAILKLSVLHPNEPFMIIQSDCIRAPEDKFIEMIKAAEELVKRDRKFISAGQKAITPDMGSDYLKLGIKINVESNLDVYSVDEFVYRLGDYNKTKDLIHTYNVSTHCNHTCWYPDLMLQAYQKYKPDWYAALMEIKDSFGKPNEKELTDKIYSEMIEGPTEDVTKYVFKDGYIILTPFNWTDVGTWDSLHSYFANPTEVYGDGKVLNIDTANALVKGSKDKLIATIGLDNIVIVDTEDALLVCAKDKTGDIKKVLDKIKEEGLTNLL